MSYKVLVPKASASWDDYWTKKSIVDDLKLCLSDELLPLFERYLTDDMIALEAGSGLGKWVVTLTRRGYNVVGLDTYAKGLERVKTFEPLTEHLAGTVSELPLKSGCLDAYISLGVVEHFEEGPQKPLLEAYRVIKPGGIAFIEVPFDNPLRKLVRFYSNLVTACKKPVKALLITLGLKQNRAVPEMVFYEYHYTKAELLTFIQEAGFTLIQLHPKDDSNPAKSIGLWLDFPKLRHPNGELFALNDTGKLVKKILYKLNRFSYSALIVAVVRK